MKILRTIIWVLAFAGFLVFALYNWNPVEITLWENLVLETKVPVLVLLTFALGLVPILAYHLSVRWSMGRRIRTLENSLRSAALARHPEAPGIAVPAADPVAVDMSVEKSGTMSETSPDPLRAELGPTDHEVRR